MGYEASSFQSFSSSPSLSTTTQPPSVATVMPEPTSPCSASSQSPASGPFRRTTVNSTKGRGTRPSTSTHAKRSPAHRTRTRSISRAGSEGSSKSTWVPEVRQCENNECGAERQGAPGREWAEEEQQHDHHACGGNAQPQHDSDMDIDKSGSGVDYESGEGAGEDGDNLCCICHDPIDGHSADDVSDVLDCHKDERMHQQCLAMWMQRQPQPSCPLCRQPALRSDAWAQQLLREGKAFFNQGRYRDAISALESALCFRRKWYFNDELRVASCLNELGISYTRMHRLEEAVRCLQEAVETKRRLLPPTAVSLAVSLCNLACAYHGQGRHEEARVLLEEDLSICRAVEPRLSHGIATSLIHLGKVLLALGQAQQAAGVFREALYICKCVLPFDHTDTALCLKRLGLISLELQQWPEALGLLCAGRDMILRLQAATGERDPDLPVLTAGIERARGMVLAMQQQGLPALPIDYTVPRE